MTFYEQLIELKYRQGVSTHELVHLFPGQIKYVSEVALLQIPDETLKQVVREKDILDHLLDLKKQFGVSD